MYWTCSSDGRGKKGIYNFRRGRRSLGRSRKLCENNPEVDLMKMVYDDDRSSGFGIIVEPSAFVTRELPPRGK
jgi:hypothetical protein